MTTSDEVKKLIQAARARYEAAAHAMQSGVAFDPDTTDREPKHLRVGINTAHADISALAGLLLKKGVFTELEYFEALAEGMEAEKVRYEQYLAKKFSKPVHLG